MPKYEPFQVEYRADTLRLSLLDLARSGNRLVSVNGRLNFKCNLEQQDLIDNHIPSGGRGVASSSESIVVSFFNCS
jgi:hypothetical protein